MKRKVVFAYLVCFALCSIFADNKDLLTGLDAYSRGDWTIAVESFERALTGLPADRTEALYWLVMSETSAQNYQRALNYADRFLQTASEDTRAAEVSYQKGRLLHLSGSYEASSDTFYRFIEKYPEHPKVPSAYYWIGENLYAVGKYTEARKIFNEVVTNYPQSGKVNEARYKIVLIDQQSVREELLRMASEVNTSAASEQAASEAVEPVSDPKPVESEATVADDTSLIEERKRDEYFADRLTTLEKKLDEISATLARIAEEQENQRMREQQQAFEQQQKAEQLQKEQEEAERKRLEQRRQELADLKERTQTLEKLYEQRTKGAK